MRQEKHRFLTFSFISFIAILMVLASMLVVSNHAYAVTMGKSEASVNLKHTPYGSASLSWSPQTDELMVVITLTGLAPNSTHPAHIHQGDCSINGSIVYMLNNVVADAAGRATTTTVISNVTHGIPASGWYVNVHNGPGLQPADQFIPIACGNVKNNNTSLKTAQCVTLALGATNAANQDTSGSAKLTLKQNTLIVVVTVHGLVPGSEHAAHIHAGSCQFQIPGNIVYPLNNVVADGSGDATETTVIPYVASIPAHGWYINVHLSTDLSTQTGFDPIVCGNVVN
jgi:hypothetical protein